MGDRVLTELPEKLKLLIKYIMRGFYKIEEAIIMDLLMHHPCIKEDDLIELVKFDRKQLRGYINTLKQEHFIKVRMRVETDGEGRATRHNYYYISYNVFINVVKYKLHNMRRKIEVDERQSTHRASFICPGCLKQYTDLDVGQLNSGTGQLICFYCQSEVNEELCDTPKSSLQSLMVRFNHQMEPIYKLLQELDGISLAPEILEPQPKEMKSSRAAGGSGARGPGDKWSGSATKNIGFDYRNEVTIAMEGETAAAAKPAKEAPVWMKESTVDGAKAELSIPSAIGGLGAAIDGNLSQLDSNDIMQALLSHETKSAAASRNDSSDSDSESNFRPASSQADEEDMENFEEDEAEKWMVTVGGNRIPYQHVKDEMLALMTPAEKEEYIRIGKLMYEDMYDM